MIHQKNRLILSQVIFVGSFDGYDPSDLASLILIRMHH